MDKYPDSREWDDLTLETNPREMADVIQHVRRVLNVPDDMTLLRRASEIRTVLNIAADLADRPDPEYVAPRGM